jgi:hypothetical protein
MDIERAALVICLTLFVVIGINAAIYVSFRKGEGVKQVDLFRQAFKTVRQPWKSEDDSLKELSDLVSELKQPASSSPEDSGDPTSSSKNP